MVDASVDTETRASGALFIAFGGAYIWAVRHSRIRSSLLRLLAATMALIGVSRIVSALEIGSRQRIFVASTVIEFIAAATTYWYSCLGDPPPWGREPDRKMHQEKEIR